MLKPVKGLGFRAQPTCKKNLPSLVTITTLTATTTGVSTGAAVASGSIKFRTPTRRSVLVFCAWGSDYGLNSGLGFVGRHFEWFLGPEIRQGVGETWRLKP